MRLTQVAVSGFRCFSPTSPLEWNLRPGMNVLVGENDSGKTAIIDAIRLVLGTRSEEFRLSVDDFHLPAEGPRATSLLARCSFASLTPEEESGFMECCALTNEGAFILHAAMVASLVQGGSGAQRAVVEWRSGRLGEGPHLHGAIREYLRSTYLRPLRDAEAGLAPGRRSRLSQILRTLPEMKGEDVSDYERPAEPSVAGAAAQNVVPQTITGIVAEADDRIRANRAVRHVERDLNDRYLGELLLDGAPQAARLGLGSAIGLTQILERLELSFAPPDGSAERMRHGLGLNNVLFMAAELLVLQQQREQLPLLLVEEPEAHLHPQLQARFADVMSERAASPDSPVQIVMTTHSPLLASNLDLESLTMVVGGAAYSMAHGETCLDADDYRFLRRFLDATKANLFFARGVLVVEGDSENILLPAIAEKMGIPLSRYGVSIVSVGHVGAFRYSRILQRRDGAPLPIPVARVADVDVVPESARDLVKKGRKTDAELGPAARAAREKDLKNGDGANVKTFVSPWWTLEYDLAREGFAREVADAVRLAYGRTHRRPAPEISVEGLSAEAAATLVCEAMKDLHVGKPAVAAELAAIIVALPDAAQEFEKRVPDYLTRAIRFATRTAGREPAAREPGDLK